MLKPLTVDHNKLENLKDMSKLNVCLSHFNL